MLILTGCNDNPEYTDMMGVLAASCEDNAGILPVCNVFSSAKTKEEAAAAKVRQILYAFHRGEKTVVWLDADTIVRGPLDGLWSDMNPGAMKITFRPDHDAKFKFNTGVIVLTWSLAVDQMVKGWAERIAKDDTWLNDQLYLWKEWKHSNVELLPLEHKYNDSHLAEDSIIWHGKGHARRDPRWLKEQKRYA